MAKQQYVVREVRSVTVNGVTKCSVRVDPVVPVTDLPPVTRGPELGDASGLYIGGLLSADIADVHENSIVEFSMEVVG